MLRGFWPRRPKSQKAIFAALLGFGAFSGLAPIAGPLAILLGRAAKRDLRESSGWPVGVVLANVGIGLGAAAMVVVPVVLVVVYLA